MTPGAGQIVMVTGATDGIGRCTARELAAHGATVLLHGRSEARGREVLEAIGAATGNGNLEYFNADFRSLDQVRAMAERIREVHPRIDVLINNAGIGSGSKRAKRELSADGIELRFAVNYLAAYLLTQELLPSLRASAPARIVNVASAAQQALDFDDLMLDRGYSGWRAYCQSKLAMVMHAFDLAADHAEAGVCATALHPGSLLDTKLVRSSFGYAWGEPESGAACVSRLALAPELAGVTGSYFDEMTEARADPQAYDPRARARLRALSEALLERPGRQPS